MSSIHTASDDVLEIHTNTVRYFNDNNDTISLIVGNVIGITNNPGLFYYPLIYDNVYPYGNSVDYRNQLCYNCCFQYEPKFGDMLDHVTNSGICQTTNNTKHNKRYYLM